MKKVVKFPHQVTFREDTDITLFARMMARVSGRGTYLKREHIQSIACNVFDVTDRKTGTITEITPAPSAAIADCIYDELQLDAVCWEADDIGFNFAHDVPGRCFAQGGRSYRVEYFFTLQGGSTFVAGMEGPCLERHAG